MYKLFTVEGVYHPVECSLLLWTFSVFINNLFLQTESSSVLTQIPKPKLLKRIPGILQQLQHSIHISRQVNRAVAAFSPVLKMILKLRHKENIKSIFQPTC